jgi:hypothetical protein
MAHGALAVPFAPASCIGYKENNTCAVRTRTDGA